MVALVKIASTVAFGSPSVFRCFFRLSSSPWRQNLRSASSGSSHPVSQSPPSRWDPSLNEASSHTDSSVLLSSKIADAEEEGAGIDWRDFRARLVAAESGSDRFTEENNAPSTSWAYDSGRVIEKGSVILSCPEQDFGYGLRQQYFHKCVILVLDHDENLFTKGIIINRPTDLVLSDDDFMNSDGTPLEESVSSNKWTLWYGGDVQGLSSDSPEIVCLHSLEGSSLANEVSTKVIKGIQWTNLEGARKLVRAGEAKPTDFWVFCGYAGWNPGQLMDEIDREAWYMIASDSQTLLKELAKQSVDLDPRGAGLGTWGTLMEMIGRGEMTEHGVDGFDDLMLKEWARQMLVFTETVVDEEESGTWETIDPAKKIQEAEPMNSLIGGALNVVKRDIVAEGTIVRAPSGPSPFVLDDQEFHKSVLLILQDDDKLTIGVLLNRPEKHLFDLGLGANEPRNQSTTVVSRYGGRYGLKGQDGKPLVFLHFSKALRDAQVGAPIGTQLDGMWKCTKNQAAEAINTGIGTARDFLAINGFSLWGKEDGGLAGGMQAEVSGGNFEVVPRANTPLIWECLVSQDPLSVTNLDGSLRASESVWIAAGDADEQSMNNSEEKSFVTKNDAQLSKLADEALRSWVATFILGKAGRR